MRRRFTILKLWTLMGLLFLIIPVGCVRQEESPGSDTPREGEMLSMSARYPEAGDHVPTSSSMWISFSAALDSDSVNGDSVILRDEQGQQVDALVLNTAMAGTVKVEPSSPLDPGSHYSLEVTTELTALDGCALEENQSWEFTTTAGADITAPHLDEASLVPADGEGEAAGDMISLAIEEDYALDPLTINSTTVTLTNDTDTVVDARIVYDALTGTIRITPLARLASDGRYLVTVAGIADMSGNLLDNPAAWSFTVMDYVAPEILSVSPDTDDPLPVDAAITVTFSEDMIPETVNAGTISLTDELGNSVPGTVSYDAAGRSVEFTPAGELTGSMTYTFILTGGLRDVTGNSLTAQSRDYRTETVQSRWTIMVYMGGDCAGGEGITDELQDMAGAGFTGKDVRIIVLADYSGQENSYLYEIMNGTTRRLVSHGMGIDLTGGEVNTGSQATLTAFIAFVKEEYPADNYALVLWNHRAGRMASQELQAFQIPRDADGSSDTRWLLTDENSGSDPLTIEETHTALSGQGISLLGMDTSGMASLEVAAGLSDAVAYLAVSQHRTVPQGWDYAAAFNAFISLGEGGQTALALGRIFADTYISSAAGRGETADLDLNIIDCNTIRELIADLNDFAGELAVSNGDEVTLARNNSHSFEMNRSVDLYNLCQESSFFADSAALQSSIDASVAYRSSINCSSREHGISLYFPVLGELDPDYSGYTASAQDFTGTGEWDEFIAEYYDSTPKQIIETISNGSPGSEYTDTTLCVFDAQGRYLGGDDDGGRNWLSRLRLPLAAGETYYILSYDRWGRFGPYALLVNDSGGGISTGTSVEETREPDDAWSAAGEAEYDTAVDLYLGAGDRDWSVITMH